MENIKGFWPRIDYQIQQSSDDPYEAKLLKLDCSKAYAKLKWMSVWNNTSTFDRTIQWYREFYEKGNVTSLRDLSTYVEDARAKSVRWAI